jgi:hypothetical protein
VETHFARIREDEEGITAVAMAIASSIAGGGLPLPPGRRKT